MKYNIVNGMGAVTHAVKECVRMENVEGGILEDVETIIPISENDVPIDPPAVWIAQHPTIQYGKENLSNVLNLQSTFEFVCVDYDDDLEVAEELGQNLATRVGACILKNHNKVRQPGFENERLFQKVKFHTFYPVGQVKIAGKAESVPAASIVFDFIHQIRWLDCIRI